MSLKREFSHARRWLRRQAAKIGIFIIDGYEPRTRFTVMLGISWIAVIASKSGTESEQKASLISPVPVLATHGARKAQYNFPLGLSLFSSMGWNIVGYLWWSTSYVTLIADIDWYFDYMRWFSMYRSSRRFWYYLNRHKSPQKLAILTALLIIPYYIDRNISHSNLY